MSRAVACENAITFDCEGESLLGILHVPALPADVGVVVVVGGPQYRAGSHRQFVLLARALAAKGYAVLRFDYRGMGDSGGPQRSFETVSADIAAAVDALHKHVPQVQRVALWGLCDGASAALLYLHDTDDRRVAGICLVNPWVRSEASLARTHVKHYYAQRLRQREFWQKLLRGQVAASAWGGLLANLRTQRGGARAPNAAPFQTRMAKAWRAFDRPILLILSGDDYTAKEFIEYTRTDPAWEALLEYARLEMQEMPNADHTFSTMVDSAAVDCCTAAWLATSLSKAKVAGYSASARGVEQ